MSKIEKWWKKISIWQKVGAIISPFAGGGEAIVIANNGHWVWHTVMIAATVVCIYATKVFTDNNGDGIVDQMQ